MASWLLLILPGFDSKPWLGGVCHYDTSLEIQNSGPKIGHVNVSAQKTLKNETSMVSFELSLQIKIIGFERKFYLKEASNYPCSI